MIHVAVGVIFNENGQVLIAKRPPGKTKAGLWEFPGGKVESEETVFEALKRELREEVGIHVEIAEQWLKVPYDYGDRKVLLDCWKVLRFTGQPYGAENQIIQWSVIEELNLFEFPAGNKPILDSLLLNL